MHLGVDILKLDALARSKISKRLFFIDIENSFYEFTRIDLEPHQFFFFFEISHQIQLLEIYKPLSKMGRGWQAVQAMAKFFFFKFAQTHDEQMLKFSNRSFDLI